MSVFADMRAYILERIVLDPGRGCWLWEGQIARNGYGCFRQTAKGKWRKAHRESFGAFVGGLTAEDCVLHHCDVPGCVNPAHLYSGTQQQNVADMVARGRCSKGPERKNFCQRGHALTRENRLGRRGDDCKTCHRLRQAKYRSKNLAIFTSATPSL